MIESIFWASHLHCLGEFRGHTSRDRVLKVFLGIMVDPCLQHYRVQVVCLLV